MTLLKFLQAQAWPPERPALVYRGVTLSRAELFERVDSVAGQWLQMGLRPGNGVALSLRHPAVHLVCLLAAARMGAVAAVFKPDSPGFVQGGWMYPLGFRFLVHDQSSQPDDVTVRFDRVCIARELLMSPPSNLPTDLQGFLHADHGLLPWSLPQSSGTTGQPKTVVVNQLNTIAAVQMGEQFDAQDRVLLLTDLSMHWTVLNVLRILRAGATCLPVATGTLPSAVLQTLRETAAHKLLLSADAAAKLLSYLEDFGDAALAGHRLNQVLIGGGQVSSALAKGLHRFLGAEIRVVYGSTEAGPMAYVHVAEAQQDSLLKLYPGVEAEVVDDADRPLPMGQQGRLRIRSAALFSGYLQNGQWPLVAPSWFYPGDLAVLSSSGLRLMGRSDHVLNLGGFKINPEPLEQALRDHPDVLDAAVLAAPLGRKQVQVLVALLVLRSPSQLSEIRAAFEREHPKAHCPQHYAVVHELPRNLSGKLQRGLLTHMVLLEEAS